MTQQILFPPEADWSPIKDFPSLRSAKRIGVDTETHDPTLEELGPGVRRDGEVVGLSVSIDNLPGFYLPFRHKDGGNIDPPAVLGWARDEFKHFEGEVVGANLLYDLDFLAEEKVCFDFQKVSFLDVMVAEPLLNENKFSYSLDSIGKEHLGEGKDEMLLREAAIAHGVDPKSGLHELHSKYVGPYAEYDAELPCKIIDIQLKKLADEGLMELFRMESALIPVLLKMRRRGIRVDLKRAAIIRRDLKKQRTEFVTKASHIAKCKVVPSKVATFGQAIEDRGFLMDRTPITDKFAISKGWMEAREHDELIYNISQARKIDTLINTFIDGYLFTHAVNGRIHCEFNQLKRDRDTNKAVGTGSKKADTKGTIARFSSSNPNLQNIPGRTKIGKMIRNCFLPEEGEDYWKHDWSQIEYRMLAHFALGKGAEEARQQYKNDPRTDFHNMCQAMAGKVNPAMLDKERGQIKNGNFGIVYGSGIGQTAITMGLSFEEAEAFMAIYQTALPFVKNTGRIAMKIAQQRGYVLTIMHRRGRFDLWEPIKFERGVRRKKALPYDKAMIEYKYIKRAYTHKALSRVLQGSAADLMKKAMVDIEASGVGSVIGASLLTVHDELGNSVPRTKEGREAIMELKRIMETCMTLKVPIIAEGEVGPSWGEVKKLV